MWGLDTGITRPPTQSESLSDRVEALIVTFLQKQNEAVYLEIETDLYPRFPAY